jgi:hypothetical protein
MKKYAVHGTVEVEVVKEVWANSEEEAYEKAHNELSSLTEYIGNGGSDKLIGVDGDGESVFACGSNIDYNDIEVLEDNPDYFECPECGEVCDVCEQDDGTTYWHCEDCDRYYDEDGDEFYPDVDDEEEE